ncbi:hypothetical protein GDO78_001433 [Eleutherodactylus coqui]|uniref:SOGA 1/2-like coiled-coil domain-containing protein n=1 Tax=Eleutherodactylus coqui TaxID=57060 RepID=A0A8J6FVN7_ELECQ|nr:hypothetical protein GDO78_001433 [Eleutherodactylus coqui]
MDLRTQLENNDWNWKVEKMELLERFDSERKEWECQWKMMQNKIEELYQEVKLRREKNLNGAEDILDEKMLQFSMPLSQATKTPNVAKQNDVISIKPDGRDRMWPNDHSHTNMEKTQLTKSNQNHTVCSVESERSIAQRMSKAENDTLNDALKEIARVSEELCKFQEEIQTRTFYKKAVSHSVVEESRRKFHVKTVRNHTSCPKVSTNKQKDSVSSSKTMQVSFSTAKPSAQQEKVDRSLETQNTAVSSLNFSWLLSNSLLQDEIPITNENQVAVTSSKVTTDAELNDDGELCHLEWLCGIGGLEDGNFTQTLFNSFTDINSFTPEMCKQNLSVSQNHFFNSDSLYPEVIMLGHSTAGSAYSYGNTIKNGKLAAKIDEFNRVVFKAGKGNAVSHDETSVNVALKIDEEHLGPSVSQPSTTGKAITKPLAISEIREPPTHNSTKVEKPTPQRPQTKVPHTTSSYKNILQKHNWNDINLSGRPRSADSRSNYGVVEKLLKSYETKAAAPICNARPSVSKWTQSGFLLTDSSSESLTQCLERLQLEQTAKVLQNDIHWYPHQDSLSLKLPEVSKSSSSVKGFSRPARPANRRPPSRWASARSPSIPAVIRRAAH